MKLGTSVELFRITQLALVQAHAVSGHKAQGQTVERIVISHLHCEGCFKPGELHCLLAKPGGTAASRTKTRFGLELSVRQLARRHIRLPRAWVLAEMHRLQHLHDTALTHLDNLHKSPANAAAPHAQHACESAASDALS